MSNAFIIRRGNDLKPTSRGGPGLRCVRARVVREDAGRPSLSDLSSAPCFVCSLFDVVEFLLHDISLSAKAYRCNVVQCS